MNIWSDMGEYLLSIADYLIENNLLPIVLAIGFGVDAIINKREPFKIFWASFVIFSLFYTLVTLSKP